ncbi:ROK family transcriptional regulator [Demequina sp. NBRC 110052]|uniref:ROK family transcriptional regulator n=1 Tax=Demequina sp. NBRC 110052 TaxID=1570341 RepID=UPI0009FD0098|nr:ROK family transcriptional regulator [Demequina sp. NBRC 110052]
MPDPKTLRRTNTKSATTATLRQRHRAQVLTEILLAQRTTRAELAEQTGLSVASITSLVAGLIADGVVAEVGSLASRGGRPVTLLAPDPDGAYALGADVGERGVAVELFDLSMEVLDREEVEADESEPVNRIVDDIDTAVSALRSRHASRWERVTGLGLALPGPVEISEDGSQTLYAQSLGWDPVPVGSLASTDLRVFADNGAKAQARAEMWFGSARGAEHAIVALLGRGVGLGVIVEGQIHRGTHSSAGEWGHTTIRPGGRRCRCGNLGCLEAYAGADAILQAWVDVGGVPSGSGWEAITALLDAADAGDAAARSVVDDVLLVVGASLGGLVNLLNPEKVVLGGWVGMLLMSRYEERIREALDAHSLARPAGQAVLAQSTFQGDAVALGAAILALEPLLDGTFAQPRHSV